MDYSNPQRHVAWRFSATIAGAYCAWAPRFALVACLLFFSSPLVAYTPESPEVKAMIKKGLQFLSRSDDHRLGGKCLVALAFLKEAYPDRIDSVRKHPKIVEAVAACREAIATDPSLDTKQGPIYSLGLAIIFLCELDSEAYRPEIDVLLTELQKKQKAHGGWGYRSRERGDTSMTQYGILSAWTADHKGIPVPQKSLERAIQWLMRTQQPDGGFGYQAVDPGHYNGTGQRGVTPSMSAAGTGSVLMSADILKLIKVKHQVQEDGVPLALNLVRASEPEAPKGRKIENVQVDVGRVGNAIQRGNNWFAKNYIIDFKPNTHYYLYSLERYKSFLELAQGYAPKKGADGPSWYNDGVKLLKATQKKDGSWQSEETKAVDTAFAVLFLLRSTQKSIGPRVPMGGALRGGRGNLDSTEVLDGQVVHDPVTAATSELLRILNDPEHPDYQRIVGSQKNVFLATGEKITSEQALRLRQLISGGEPPVRIAAVKALARTRELEHVPTLIYALTDPDWNVVISARDGLRFLSRKFAGFGIPDSENNERREVAIRAWKRWYLAIRPDAVFLD